MVSAVVPGHPATFLALLAECFILYRIIRRNISHQMGIRLEKFSRHSPTRNIIQTLLKQLREGIQPRFRISHPGIR
jgi:hypothetical protein